MPRSVDDILKHADELARRFEDYEPGPRTSAILRLSVRCVERLPRGQMQSGRSETGWATLDKPGSRGH